MTFKGIIQEMRDGIGSISRRGGSFDLKQLAYHHRSQSVNAVLDESQFRASVAQQSCWATMPPELLRDIVQRVELSESTWPGRRDVVACAGVCRAWREITKELVKPIEQSGKPTFPISLKQPGPRDGTVQCFIKRDRTASTYCLFLSLSPTLGEPGKFLLAARKVRRPTSTDYIISLDADDRAARGSNTNMGKLRSNFLGTKFTIYESQPSQSGSFSSISRAVRRVGAKQVLPRVPTSTFNVAYIAYELNVLGTRGPRRMQCTMHSIPASALHSGGGGFGGSSTPSDYSLVSLPSFGFKSTSRHHGDNNDESRLLRRGSTRKEGGPALVLKNKSPRWHEQLQCWCLNFRGRVTVASVKNFQLVAELPDDNNISEPAAMSQQSDSDSVILQFGKVGKDMFTMDYRYPLSAFQAFAICLSSFDTKLACE